MSDVQTQPPQLVDRKGRVFQERTVVVKKEQDGFGFTLSKEMPVFVNSVSPGSSADRAGILSGDRIMKVNGVSVVGHRHNEVVEMIRFCSHVTLTVINKLNQNGSKAPKDASHGVDISPPRQLQELTLQSLKTMLQRQRKVYETLTVEYSKTASEKLEKELRDCESIIKILEIEISSKSPAIEVYIQTTSASVDALTGKPLRTYPHTNDHSHTKKLLGSEVDARKMSASPTKFKSLDGPHRAHTFSNGTVSPTKPWRRRYIPGPFNPPMHEEVHVSDGSDEDLSDEVVDASEVGPFSSLQELRNNPAHMAVFLHYLYSNKDPKYLLFYVVATSYQNQCKTTEMLKQRGMDIYWTFLLDNSPLRIELDESMKARILNTLETEESENKLKSAFLEVRESLSEVIIAELADYRHKRVIGLAGMFGDHMLSHQMSISKQIEVVHNALLPDLKQCLDEKSADNPWERVRNQSIAACIATFIMDSTGKTRDRFPSFLEKVQTFSRSDILVKKGKARKKTPSLNKNGHTFQLTSYSKPSICDFCSKLLWGIIYHGYQCIVCEFNVHRNHCVNETLDSCPGKRKRKLSIQMPRKSSLTFAVLEEPDMSVDPTLRAEEEERLSPPPGFTDMDVEGSQTARRDRSISEPKHHMLVECNSVCIEQPSQDQPEHRRKDNIVTRTQSERLQTKPDHVPVKHTSVEQQMSATLSWNSVHHSSSDDSLIGGTPRVGSLDAIAEVPSGGKLPIVDEEIKEFLDDEVEDEPIPWALTAKRELVQGMKRYEIQRQENIKELVYTERSHLQKLNIMRHMYKSPLVKQNILSPKEAEQLFPSLEELIFFHSALSADLKERVTSSPNTVVKSIADVLLQRFDGAAGERLCHACSVFASNQVKADRLFKEWKRRNERFRTFVKNTESHPLCQKLTLNELMPIAWQRLTKYKLLIESILGSYKKHWEELDDADKGEGERVETALTCVKSILQYVNQQVRHAENKQHLLDYQAKLDTSALDKASHPIAQLFKNLDLTAEGRRLIHKGPLTWRIQHRKVVELYALLLTDILVLMEKPEDKDKYYLRCHSHETVNGVKEELSPVIRLNECLLRHAAADKGGRTFFLVDTSSLMKLAQMYEFIAEGPQEKKHWEEAIRRAMMGTQDQLSPELPMSPIADDYPGRLPLGLSPLTSHLNPREQLDKIDDDMKKLLTDKLNIIRGMQGGISGERVKEIAPQHRVTRIVAETPKDIVSASIEQAGEIIATVSHIMVPNPTKSIIAETQSRLTDIIAEIQRNLSKLLIVMDEQPTSAGRQSIPHLPLDLPGGTSAEALVGSKEELVFSPNSTQDLEQTEMEPGEVGSREASKRASDSGVLPHLSTQAVSTSEEVLPKYQSCESLGSGVEEQNDSLTRIIVAPPDTFSGDNSATPTPQNRMDTESTGDDSSTPTPQNQMDTEFTGADSDTTTPRTSPCDQLTSPSPQVTVNSSVVEVQPKVINGSSSSDESPLVVFPSSAAQDDESGIGPGIKVLTVISSSGHDSYPSLQQEQPSQEENIPSYSLSRSRQESTTSSESQDKRDSDSYEGTDL